MSTTRDGLGTAATIAEETDVDGSGTEAPIVEAAVDGPDSAATIAEVGADDGPGVEASVPEAGDDEGPAVVRVVAEVLAEILRPPVKTVPMVTKHFMQFYGCAPACLAMAARFFGRAVTLERVCELAGSGPFGYTLPWELALGARKLGLDVTFVSKAPSGLNAFSIESVAVRRGSTARQVAANVARSVGECRAQGVRLETWTPRIDLEFVKSRAAEKDVIVIPALWWGSDVHNVVLTGHRDGRICYNDPNEDGGVNRSMTEAEFSRIWNDRNTDNDLFIVADGAG